MNIDTKKIAKCFSKNTVIKIYIIFALLILIRIIVSLLTASFEYQSDEITYLNMIFGLYNNHKIQPHGGVFLDYQWFISIFYFPFILISKSKILIIIINNILYAISIFLLSKVFFAKVSVGNFGKVLFYFISVFFPFMFNATNYLLTEGLFIFLLSIIIFVSFYDYKFKFYLIPLLVLLITGFILTRPIARIFILIIIVCLAVRKNYKIVFISLISLGIGIFINNFAKECNNPEGNIKSLSVCEVIYISNTTYSDGSTDQFLSYQKHYLNDTTFLKYKDSKIGDKELILELKNEILSEPIKYLDILKAKTLCYLFNIWNDSWNYPTKQNQLKQIVALILFSLFYLFVILGIISKQSNFKDYKYLFVILFTFNLLFHLLLVARMRYNLPILFLGLPLFYLGLRFAFAKCFKSTLI